MKKKTKAKVPCVVCEKKFLKHQLVTMPGILRKRTDEEQKAIDKEKEDNTVISDETAFLDKRNRKFRVCRSCVLKMHKELEQAKGGKE